MIRAVFIVLLCVAAPAFADEPEPYPIHHPQTEEEKARISQHLATMVEADQAARGAIDPHQQKPERDAAWEAEWQRILTTLRAVDAENYIDLHTYVQTYGWFPISIWGERTSFDAWLLAQHMDVHPDFQNRILVTMAVLLETDDVSKRNYAYLYDRVARGQDRPQLYGTQGGCTGPGEWTPNPIEDEENIETRRADMGLEPLTEYQAQISRLCVDENS